MDVKVTRQAQDHLPTVAAEFEFLVAEYGYTAGDQRRELGGFTLYYSRGEVGVAVDWHPRDPLSVWLVRLVDGAFPPKGQTVMRADATLHYFDLGHLEAFSGDAKTGQLGPHSPSVENAQLLARSLRTCGAAILSGYTGHFDALQEYTKERARQVTIARYGAEYARTLGW
ncbi:hypothetical protein F4553_001928 [Allocatelliglobosispora scoriae]|uniref:Uncharacterized protein n=1 Tax=Allocatelliglobosispora scoriae TaxID=643052 RepID=A0A841BMY5_9ACTN|nr:hypothetical protein [Allocatelliglobosispora scoriae]MBB5868549.1 hypothetical protein [Allocatelliglobosispora scoriae]